MNALPRIALTFFLILSSVTASADDLIINGAWIREAPPVSRVQAGYLSLRNTTNHKLEIVSASSPAYTSIGFHETVVENGLSKMFHLESITIPAKSQLELKPEGMHLMLFNPVKPLRDGDAVEITFRLDTGTSIKASFMVKKSGAISSHQHTHH